MNPLELCATSFSEEGLRMAQKLSRQAMEEIAAQLKPGMREPEGVEIASRTLKRLGSPRAWHRSVVRFGPNTVYSFSENRNAEAVLQKSDLFFLDLGPNWVIEGVEYEGDVGDTYTVGDGGEAAGLAGAVEQLYAIGCQRFQTGHITGKGLYDYLVDEAARLGYELVRNVDGHRISEFSHQRYFRHGLCEIDFEPMPGRWILEIQLRDRSKPYGAFYEDLLA